MPNAYKPGLISYRPQYTSAQPDEPEVPENILWVQTSVPANTIVAANLITLQAHIDPLWAAVWEVTGSSAYAMVGSIATDWSNDTGVQNSSVGTFTAVDGSVSGAAAGAQVAGLISWVGEWPRYRGGHPRTYLPFVGNAALSTPWEFTTAKQTAANTAITSYVSGIYDYTWTIDDVEYTGYVAAFRFRDDPAKAQTYMATSGTLGIQPATQRRRLRKVTRK
jgi:hypothetical protein